MDEEHNNDDWGQATEIQKQAATRIAAAFNLAPMHNWPAMQEMLLSEFGIEVNLVDQRERRQ